MSPSTTRTTIAALALGAVAAFVAIATIAVAAQQPAQRARVAFDRALAPMDGKHLVMKVVDVRYGPGESSAPHRHGCAVVVFVIDGAVRMSVRGGRDSVYRRGETFHETPTDVHQVSANASASDSAHFTASFVCDHEGPLSTPATDAPPAARH